MQEHRQHVNAAFRREAGVEDWLQLSDLNLDQATCTYGGISVYDRSVLLHSEINSPDLKQYQSSGFEPAYWLSHAMIARDWYRFAQHDLRLQGARHMQQPFLIYSRGFTGSREYRPKFLEQLCQHGLAPHARVSCLHQENGQNLRQFRPVNHNWQLDLPQLVLSLPECRVASSASADYDIDDVRETACQIVLETRFDGDCLHLTEKTFRPIATAQPFVLMAAPGALALLRRYGFETYQGLVDERYDLITNSQDRMQAILQEMRRLARMDRTQWQQWCATAEQIARRNQARFFSDDFEHMIWDECVGNLKQALDRIESTRGQRWLLQRRLMRQNNVTNWYAYQHRANEHAKANQLRALRQGRYIPSQSSSTSVMANASMRDSISS